MKEQENALQAKLDAAHAVENGAEVEYSDEVFH
jgi:hypothetical protein